jgi:general secretion pathway protein J
MKQLPNGFTLVELLVSLAIFALISILIFGGFRFGLRTWENGTDRIDRMSQIGMVQDLLRRELAVATLPRRERRDGRERESAIFVGAQASIRFVGMLPIHNNGSQYYTIDVRTYPSREHRALFLSWQSYGPDTAGVVEGRQGETDLLLDQVAGVEFSYFGQFDRNRPAGWVSEWVDPRNLPQLVRVRVIFPPEDLRSWPDLIVAPRLSFR